MNNNKFRVEIKNTASGDKYAELKGPETKDVEPVSVIDIPEYIIDEESGEKITVGVIGNHAFSSRKDITEVRIPDSVHTILGFAFHNCGKLKKISLTDSVEEYLDGGTRQCESLEEIEVTVKRDNYEVVRRILEDNDRRLSFRLHLKDGDALLVFPGFVYDFVENTMARTIQFAIEGTGYAYRECVKPHLINIREYDNLFSKAAADDRVTAEMIAMGRLKFPYMLTEDAKKIYLNWLKDNAPANLGDAMMTSGDAEVKVDFYRKRELIHESDIPGIISTAVECGKTAIVSLLMEYQRGFQKKEDSDDELTLDF